MTTLGHVQRGGTPGAFDRLLATRLAAAAIDSLARGEHGHLIGLLRGEVSATPLERGGRHAQGDRSRAAQAAESARQVIGRRLRASGQARCSCVHIAVIVGGLLLYMPLAGSYGLWDPWETHYSEVARQMTHRGDFISLWWPGSPRDPERVLVEAGAVVLADEHRDAHRRRGAARRGSRARWRSAHAAEWAARVPFCVMGVLGIYAVYLVTTRFVSRRAGVLAAVVLATAPMYSLVARQAMTDMAFVGPMAMALALGALALFDDADEVLPRAQATGLAGAGRTTVCSTGRWRCSRWWRFRSSSSIRSSSRW